MKDIIKELLDKYERVFTFNETIKSLDYDFIFFLREDVERIIELIIKATHEDQDRND